MIILLGEKNLHPAKLLNPRQIHAGRCHPALSFSTKSGHLRKVFRMLRITAIVLSASLLLLACGRKDKVPDVSGIQVDLELVRFEKDFFALDSLRPEAGLDALQAKYPGFTEDFVERILGIPWNDTSEMKSRALRQFLSDYRPILAEANEATGDFSVYQQEVRKALQYVKYYFPAYPLPRRLITFVGPLDAYAEGQVGGYGDIITPEGLAVGLQLHLGSQSPVYLTQQGQQLYPTYISRRFDPAYIPVNCVKNVVDDLYPADVTGKSLLEQMVDKGKRLYLLDRFLPETADSLKIGYTADQLEGCVKNEGLIWNFFTQNNLLYETDPQKIKSFVGDGPKTPELGDASPGYIALFTGRQIVRAYMAEHPDTSPQQLLSLDARTILTESKYKPR
jgi:hypothetical protein